MDISTRGRCSVPVKNLEFWEKRARKLVAINLYVDLFSSAAYLCLQQESMSVAALSRLLEAVAKPIRHSVAMSTILATELFQARHDATIATSNDYWKTPVMSYGMLQKMLDHCLVIKSRKSLSLTMKGNNRFLASS